MVLDMNLEIFKNNSNGDYFGTLYAQLNQCVTIVGKKLLKTWLVRPFCYVESIKECQEVVVGLKGVNLPSALEFWKILFKLPDMQRLLVHIFCYRETRERSANKIILYEDATKKQLQEFITTLRGCEQRLQACFSQFHHLLTPGCASACKAIKEIESKIETSQGAKGTINCLCQYLKGGDQFLDFNLEDKVVFAEGIMLGSWITTIKKRDGRFTIEEN